jgi:two-component system phosphate regulon sensor histidine kinase PhoR
MDAQRKQIKAQHEELLKKHQDELLEKEKSEQMRREFTANVSHELKTPLHAISGCAELLAHGMVKAEDTEKFAGQIYQEAQRMSRLVEDILKLSRLDEGVEVAQYEMLDLHELAEKTVESLLPVANQMGVQLVVTGEDVQMEGAVQLLQGILYNLCDNAIKYNVQGGKVTVDVRAGHRSVKLTVSDSGIGIPREHQERIFERFYRVDKSHSKQIGGTGLGLSIVKHAVRLHQANLELMSEPNQGTVITITFPRGIQGNE